MKGLNRRWAGAQGRHSDSIMESTDPIQLDLPLIYSAKVLVVDDDAETRDLLRVFFSANNYDVVTAGDGKEALAILAADSTIDIVILDVFIPTVGGMEVLRDIQSRSA